jgi:hypothetical protein
MKLLFVFFSRVQSYQRKKLVYLVVFVKLDCGAILEERISFFACKDSLEVICKKPYIDLRVSTDVSLKVIQMCFKQLMFSLLFRNKSIRY